MMSLDVSLQSWCDHHPRPRRIFRWLRSPTHWMKIKFWERGSLFWWEDDLLYDVLTWRHLQLSKILFATEAGCCKAKSHSFVDVKSHTTALVCGQRVFDTLHHRVLSWSLDQNSWAFQTGWQNRKIYPRLFQNSEDTFNCRQILLFVLKSSMFLQVCSAACPPLFSKADVHYIFNLLEKIELTSLQRK